MRLACIVRVYNEVTTGHAYRFFNHCGEWGADAVLVLDDCSTDGTADYAKLFTPYVWVREKHEGRTREMDASVFLIERAKELGVEYILFMDCDEVLTRGAGKIIREKCLPMMDRNDFSALNFTTYSLWRTPRYRRWDQLWDCEYRFPRLWKNKDLKYDDPGPNQLHAMQAPPQVYRHWYIAHDSDLAILHYAYASVDKIRDRFKHYVNIDGKRIGFYPRLVDESSLVLEWIPDCRYPVDLIPKPEDEVYIRTPEEDYRLIGEGIGTACWKNRPIEEQDLFWEARAHSEEVRRKTIFERGGRHFVFPTIIPEAEIPEWLARWHGGALSF